MNILIIDDDPAVRNFISVSLRDAEYTVFEAENGNKGLNVLQEHPEVEAVITDIIMPDKEGIETIKDIRKLFPGIKILAISGGGKLEPENYLLLAHALGAHKTLKKPFRVSELLNAIATL
ncbi:MAG: response regulator [Chlorobiaceae bacterium]|nr:response regulator [Chlorobiaceae bacterium]